LQKSTLQLGTFFGVTSISTRLNISPVFINSLGSQFQQQQSINYNKMKKAHHSPPTEARPSLTRTSYSASTTSPRQHTDESNEWEQSDIRGDMAAGWGGSNDNSGGRGSGVAGAVSAAAGVPLGVVPDDNDWGWKLQAQAVHKLPAFYPLDQRSTRRLLLWNEQQHQTEGGETVAAAAAQAPTKQELHSIGDISRRISSACQHMSIQAQWDNSIACATLFTMERVEMVISMYLEGDAGGLMGGTPSGEQLLGVICCLSDHDIFMFSFIVFVPIPQDQKFYSLNSNEEKAATLRSITTAVPSSMRPRESLTPSPSTRRTA
jgi:hypothetical protein